MATFTSSSHTFASPHSFVTHFSSRVFPSCFCVIRQGRKGNLVSLKLNLVRGLEFGKEKKRVSWWSCCCKKGWDNDADLALEAEILEFMRNSEKPEVFPSKKELVDAGRMDLVERIKRQGGWLAMGWDLDKDNGFQENGFSENYVKHWDLEKEWDNEAFLERGQSEVGSRESSSLAFNSSSSPSSSGRSLEVAAEDDSGIDGILSRLQRERNVSFGFGFREKGDNNACTQSNDSEEESLVQASMDVTVGGPGRRKLVSFSHSTSLVNDIGVKSSENQSLSGIDGLGNSTWREWSLQRAGFRGKEFEGRLSISFRCFMTLKCEFDRFLFVLLQLTIADIIIYEIKWLTNISGDEILDIRDKSSELHRRKESDASKKEINNKIQSRLEHLKLELSSVLQSLRSNVDEVLSWKGDGSSIDSLHKLSDTWEFQENEIMNAQDKLRSIRARLTVLEGKMALAIIDARKTVEEKQNRIDDARRALQLLRTACVVWPNSASEVLLAGSFDGWATKRKMEKSRTGVFSLRLKLYPGKYEIKFIVDGEWKIDPLRPIVNNNGFENNLLIIT
ncbi:5'-AMP-activated protein kinase-related, putative isoform 1 [Theobroma cacao]|uniref:5'-AMP-activated protein kinase-related, putative isoform 1 n=1 Tax=Theobroma cacao TaxID=3641 RepID=A0A061E6G8_THECC|nr:5'-AMP-activated protein kinase-related, putative isoform 1 [Theobroma cacao]